MGLGKGYIGQSMSVNAQEAYDEEIMPKSKWTKAIIISELSFNLNEELLNRVKKLTLADLRTYFLKSAGYHHTGKFYNTTKFYELDTKYIENFTSEKLDRIENSNKWEYKSERIPLGYKSYKRLKGTQEWIEYEL